MGSKKVFFLQHLVDKKNRNRRKTMSSFVYATITHMNSLPKHEKVPFPHFITLKLGGCYSYDTEGELKNVGFKTGFRSKIGNITLLSIKFSS